MSLGALCQRNVIALTVSGGYKLLDATRKRTAGEYTDLGIGNPGPTVE